MSCAPAFTETWYLDEVSETFAGELGADCVQSPGMMALQGTVVNVPLVVIALQEVGLLTVETQYILVPLFAFTKAVYASEAFKPSLKLDIKGDQSCSLRELHRRSATEKVEG
jgi:hypothetical protein